MENVMEMTRGPWMSEIVAKISGWMKESPDGVKRGIESAVPLSIAGLAEKAATQEGAQSLLSTIKRGEYPHMDTTELGRAVADPTATENAASSGEGFLSGLFGNKQRGAVEGLASAAGVSPSSASKLLGLVMPLVMGFVGKQAVSRNMDASGLRGFLAGQRSQVASAMPGPLSRLFGGGTSAHAVEAPVTGRPAIAHPHELPAHKARSGRWLWLALAALVALGLLLWRRGARHEAPSLPSAPQGALSSDTPRPQSLFAGGVGALSEAFDGNQALPQRFVVSGLTFRTDSAEIDPTSARVLDDVTMVLTTHPGARVRIEGHTDNTGMGEANQKLSQDRADSVRAYLMGKGISGDRVEAIGYGSDRPLVTNDDPNGRAENRRTEIVALQR